MPRPSPVLAVLAARIGHRRDRLAVWNENGKLLDGHNRLEICRRHNLEFKTVALRLSDEEAAVDWIDANQLGRKNLTPEAMSLLCGRRYNRQKKKAASGAIGGASKLQSDTCLDTATAIAEKHEVSRATAIRDGAFAAAVESLRATMPAKLA